MTRSLTLIILIGIALWAPWMERDGGEHAIETVLTTFGPLPSVCYDAEGKLLQDGLALRWYPFGRLVHTCVGDFVVWVWGESTELGGVSKSADALQAVRTRALSCVELIKRQEERLSTSTRAITLFDGVPADALDISLFPNAAEYTGELRRAQQAGPNFAGKFAVAVWGCGANCINFAVTDVQTGKVIALGPTTDYGLNYNLNSTLLITNPLENLPEHGISDYETESIALSLAGVPRRYFRLTTDELSGEQYLTQICVESAATGYVSVVDELFVGVE